MSLKSLCSVILTHLNKKPDFSRLREYPMLKDLNDHELKMFSQLILEREYKEGEYIFKQDFPVAAIYLIHSGLIQIHAHDDPEASPILLHPHQFIGILDMYNQNKRRGTARVVKDSVLATISRQDFMNFIHNNPKAGVKILNRICEAYSHYIYHLQEPQEVQQ